MLLFQLCFFIGFNLVAVFTSVLIFSSSCLLILPISGFVGLMSLHVGLFRKFGL